jgi:pimeloyl-ACP methyl ester carboxylesterase
MDWIEINGAGLRYELTGSGDNTLVLVHEMGGTLESWDLVLPLLSGQRCVLRYDTRGAGLSTKIRGTGNLDLMADDIAALLDALGKMGPVTIAGGAVGGGIALHFAARHPDRVHGIIALGPATGIPAERQLAIQALADTVEREGMIQVAEDSLARSYPERLRTDRARFERFRARWLANDPGSYAAIYRMLAANDLTDEIAALKVPVLFLAGTYDPLRPPQSIEPMSATVARGHFIELPTGHFMATQTPDLVAAAFNGFLAEIEG